MSKSNSAVCLERFIALNGRYCDTIKDSFNSVYGARLLELYQFGEDLIVWNSTLEGRFDTTIFYSAIQEHEFGFQSVVSGQYRYAFVAERYFLEQVCRFIYLSAHELYLRQWKLGCRDITWSQLVDKKKGIFTVSFISAFCPDFKEQGPMFVSMVRRLYRDFSEFVHGNYKRISVVPEDIGFEEAALSQWLELAELNRFVAIFLLFIRFAKDMCSSDIEKLERVIEEELGGILETDVLCALGKAYG